MNFPDMFLQGIAAGWNVQPGTEVDPLQPVQVDVVVVGSGAGGATTAEYLAEAGYSVLVIEEGPLKTSSDFKMLEQQAYSELYQEGLGRVSKDGAITILQGRAVGGTTLINWTSSFRTPEATLQHWQDEWQVSGFSQAELAPWFERLEQRLNIAPWAVPANANNAVIQQGCEALGWDWAVIPRNVTHCFNLGYCGMGCPANAKQSMLVTSLPAMLKQQGRLIYCARAERLDIQQQRVTGLICQPLDEQALQAQGQPFKVVAKHYVLAGGSINTPALLMRSKAPDPYQRCGKRTFLHLVNFSLAQFTRTINPFYGAPQSVYSDQFQWQAGVTGPVGYKLEVPPLQPAFLGSLLTAYGPAHAELMAQLPQTNVMLSLLRDGFHPESPGGTVQLNRDGSPVLDYPVTDYLWDGLQRALLSMAEIQFAAGAKQVMPLHTDGRLQRSWRAAQEHIKGLALQRYKMRLGSAHVMGGCNMSDDPRKGVVNSLGQHHQLANLSVHDGSLFPTSIGANPQLSVYAISAKLAAGLTQRLSA